jgi:hypothetical protein
VASGGRCERFQAEGEREMSTRLKTSVDTVCVQNGVWQDRVNCVGVFERSEVIPSRGGRGNLYVMVQTVGGFPDHAQVQQRLIAVADQCFGSDGSITNGLREAIKAANAGLFEVNLNAPREQRGIAGITCIVLKDEDAYVGQVGPALLYQVARDTFRRLPQESTWLSVERLEDVDISKHPPLGLRHEIEPELSHLHIQSGDVFIASSTHLAKLARDEDIRGAVVRRGANSIRDNLEALIEGKDLSLLIIEVLAADQATAEDRAPVEAVESGQRGLAARVHAALRSLRPPPQPRTAAPAAEATEESEESRQEEPVAVAGAGVKDALQGAWAGLRRLVGGLLPILGSVLPRAEPSTGRPTRTAARDRPAQRGDKRWLWFALAIPILVTLLYAITRIQYDRSRQAQLSQLLQAAQDAKASADSSPAIADQRARLREAIAALDSALLIQPTDERIIDQRKTMQETLDAKNYVSRLLYFGLLTEFPDAGDAKSQLGTVVIRGIDIYVLDVGTDRVYKYMLTQTKDGLQDVREPVLLRKGDQRDQVVVDELLDIAWADPGAGLTGSGLLILDKKGHLLRYDPAAGLEVLPVATSEARGDPIAAATFSANLYLLDPTANAVFKYERTSTGYDVPPTNYFKPDANANVANALDLSIDGSVYVLHSVGSITKYFKGASSPFPLTDLDEPMNGACCIFASGTIEQDGFVYVADAGNQRILKFSPEGVFLRQYRSREPQYMTGLRSIFVEEAEKRVYIADGNKLYWAKLPD